MQVRKIDPKKMTAYDRYVKSKKMDKDTIIKIMADATTIDGPDGVSI